MKTSGLGHAGRILKSNWHQIGFVAVANSLASHVPFYPRAGVRRTGVPHAGVGWGARVGWGGVGGKEGWGIHLSKCACHVLWQDIDPIFRIFKIVNFMFFR